MLTDLSNITLNPPLVMVSQSFKIKINLLNNSAYYKFKLQGANLTCKDT